MKELPTPRPRRLASLFEPVVVRKFWRSRDHSAAVYVSVQTIGGRNVAAVRLWWLDGSGRIAPADGFQLDIHKAPEFAAALIAPHRHAIALALIDRGANAECTV